MTFFCASQLSICLAERDGAFELASRLQNTNFTCPEARAGFRIVDGLIFLREHRLDDGFDLSRPCDQIIEFASARPKMPQQQVPARPDATHDAVANQQQRAEFNDT